MNIIDSSLLLCYHINKILHFFIRQQSPCVKIGWYRIINDVGYLLIDVTSAWGTCRSLVWVDNWVASLCKKTVNENWWGYVRHVKQVWRSFCGYCDIWCEEGQRRHPASSLAPLRMQQSKMWIGPPTGTHMLHLHTHRHMGITSLRHDLICSLTSWPTEDCGTAALLWFLGL